MSNPIELQAAIDAVSEACFELRGVFGRCEDALKALPSAQPERKTAKWINNKPRWIPSLSMTIHDAYECSNCGEPGVHWWKYCIYCGASMEIEEWRKPIIERWRSENEQNFSSN